MADVTFSGVVLPNAGKVDETFVIPMRDALLLTGAHSIHTNTRYGLLPVFTCMGTQEQFTAVRALIGVVGDLVVPITGETYTNCYISGLKRNESNNPQYFMWTVEFKQDTTP
jgi:hypothetical protein